MSFAIEIGRLADRTKRDLDDWSDFLENSKTAWRAIRLLVTKGDSFEVTNVMTGKSFSSEDFASLAHYYIDEFYGPITLQRFVSVFESFIFEFLRILLTDSPGSLLQSKSVTIGQILASNKNCDLIIAKAIEDELNRIRYGKPRDWFDYIDSIERFGSPTTDQIDSIAEIKATRDIFEHNAGIANETYVTKSGGKARFKPGEPIDISDQYLLESWTLLRNVCDAMATVAMKRRDQSE